MRRHPPDRPALERWLAVVKAAKWKRFVDIRSTFASVDRATAGSGRPVFVFNIAGNRFRLIAAIHFNQQRIFTLRFLTHAEYDNENWKRELRKHYAGKRIGSLRSCRRITSGFAGCFCPAPFVRLPRATRLMSCHR